MSVSKSFLTVSWFWEFSNNKKIIIIQKRFFETPLVIRYFEKNRNKRKKNNKCDK